MCYSIILLIEHQLGTMRFSVRVPRRQTTRYSYMLIRHSMIDIWRPLRLCDPDARSAAAFLLLFDEDYNVPWHRLIKLLTKMKCVTIAFTVAQLSPDLRWVQFADYTVAGDGLCLYWSWGLCSGMRGISTVYISGD